MPSVVSGRRLMNTDTWTTNAARGRAEGGNTWGR
jgi:hypothetical protein